MPAYDQQRQPDIEKRLCAFLDHLPQIAIQGYGPDGTIHYWNHANEQVYGYTAAEAIGRNLVELVIPPAMRDDVRATIAAAAETGRMPPAGELLLMRKDGTRVPVYSSHAVVPRSDGSVELYCIDIDLTRQKLAEERMRRAESETRAILLALPDVLLILDENATILDVKSDPRHLVSEDADALAGRTLCAFGVDASVPVACEEQIAAALRTGAVQSCELALDLGRGPARWHARFVPFGRGTVLAVLRDATVEQQTLEALVRAERMGAVSTLAAGIAHQFNNLNAGVLGYADLLMREDDLPERPRKWATHIFECASGARDLTNKLIKIVHPDKPCRLQVKLNDVAREAADLVQEEFRAQDIKLEMRLRPMSPTLLDAGDLLQVLLNLLINAQHALLGRDKRKVVIKTGEKDGEVFLEVRDTGWGMTPGELDKAFTPFHTTKGEFSSPGSPLAAVRGVGLGLSVSDVILRQHGGRITARSTPGEGSVFTLYLPVADGKLVEEADDLPKSPVGAIRILVVDDEASSRDILRSLFEMAGHTVAAAGDGQEGLQRLASERFDVVLVDLYMPQMDGFAFLQALADIDPERRPVPIVITGRAKRDFDPDYGGIPVFDTLHKPFRMQELLERVHAAAAMRRWQTG